MATRELAEIKDKNGDVNELRDKKLADSVAKNTVVNTDNVRMVDTNGKEVFIARDSFISAIRNVLGGFILSNTKAEAPNIPVFDSNGDFGAITAANLASVLGVEQNIRIRYSSSNDDFSSYNSESCNGVTFGNVNRNSDTLRGDAPINGIYIYMKFIPSVDGLGGFEIASEYYTGSLYIRSFCHGGVGWYSWHKIF